MNYPELRSKVTVVTGAGNNLGRAIALAFAATGARVAVVDINEELAESTCAIARESGGDVKPYKTDIGATEEVEALMRRVREDLGPIDILINNAAVTQTGRPLLPDVPETLFDRIIQVNLKGVWLMMRQVIPAMVERGGGSIVNVSSIHGLVSDRGMSAYTASKHAVLGLTKAAALEWGPHGVRVNAICPSRQEGAMLNPSRSAKSLEEKLEGDRRMNPASGRAGRPEEVAATIMFLCSDGAANIHGAAIAVDGGYTIQ